MHRVTSVGNEPRKSGSVDLQRSGSVELQRFPAGTSETWNGRAIYILGPLLKVGESI